MDERAKGRSKADHLERSFLFQNLTALKGLSKPDLFRNENFKNWRQMIRAKTYNRLRKLITDRYCPGQALSEPELARLLGVSRTPVREPLARLEKDGLVKIVPQKGAFVTTLDVFDIRELFEVTEAIEVYLIRRVASRIDSQALTKLEQELDQIFLNLNPNVPPPEKFRALEGIFAELHDLIVVTAGNRRFVENIEFWQESTHGADQERTNRGDV